MRNILASAMEAELRDLFVNCQRGVATRMDLIEMSHAHTHTLEVMDSTAGDEFIDENIHQLRSRTIGMRFYWVRYRVRQGKCMVYWMAGEHYLEDYFTKHQPDRHHQAQQSTYIVPTANVSNYSCYMSPNDLKGCVEYLPSQGIPPHW